ncbi:glycosyltransferase family 2 protein, partial [Cribrihabitans sp. XS_ASV171]
ELTRREHYSGSAEYIAYAEKLREQPELWCKWSEKYINWRQLEILGLMSKGNWA